MPSTPISPTGSTPPRAQAAAARVADVRLERWYRQRGLRLPPDVQAEFTAMGVEALAGNPGRAPDAVMDELLAEFDQTLGHIHADGRTSTRPSWLQRLRHPFSRDARERTRPH